MGYRRTSVVAAARNGLPDGVGMFARRLVCARVPVPAGFIFVVSLVANREAVFSPDRVHLHRGVFLLCIGGAEDTTLKARLMEDCSLCLRAADDLGILSGVPLPRPSPN